MSTNKKVFRTSTVEKYKKYNKLSYLILVCPFLIYSIYALVSLRTGEIKDNMFYIGIFLLAGMFTIFISFIPFVICKSIIKKKLSQAIKNSKINSILDFDYYREKLTGLSPATISILTDLEIGKDKDIVATTLWLENNGYIIEDGTDAKIDGKHKYIKTEKYQELKDSNKYFIEQLESEDGFTENSIIVWEGKTVSEAIVDGYIKVKSAKERNKENKKQIFGGCVMPFLFIVIGIIWLFNFTNNRMDSVSLFLESIPDDLSLSEQVSAIASNPSEAMHILEMVLLGLFCFFSAIFPVAQSIAYAIRKQHEKDIKRTDLGNEMAEYIYGMKNFIHDYSNLSEADRREVVLWDDYLVYAIVLEENEKIVDQIKKEKERT